MGQFFISSTLRRQFARTDAFLSFCFSLLFFALTTSAASSSSIGQTSSQPGNSVAPQDNSYTLRPGEVITRNMKGNEQHTFRLTLAPKQYVHVVAEQKGVDVVVSLLTPDGQLLGEMDSPNGKFGLESISTVAELAGSYIVKVSTNNTQPAGGYELRVEGPREATAGDDRRVAAERFFMKAQELTYDADSRLTAIEQFKKALDIWREIGDAREEGYTLWGIGQTNKRLGNFEAAIEYLNQALARLNEAQDVAGQTVVLNEMGITYRDSCDSSLALASYERALELRTGNGDKWGQAQLRNNIGEVYARIGQPQNALENYELALSLWRELGDRLKEMNTLNNAATVRLDTGSLTDAFHQFQQILDYCDKTPEGRSLEPFARNSRGVIDDTWGETQEAFNEYQLALNQFRGTKDRRGQANVLDNMGMVYAGLSDVEQALNKFNEALEIRKQLNEPRGEAVTRSNIGYAEWLLGHHQNALEQLDQALSLSRNCNPPFEAYTLLRQGMVLVSLGERSKALDCYNRALKIQEKIEDHRGQAITLDKIAEVSGMLGQPGQALENYEQALKLWTSVGDKQGQALSLYGMAQVERDQNNLGKARDRIAEAIEDVESLRTKMTSHRLRMTYFAARQDYYQLEIDIRMRLYEVTGSKTDMELALFASERARARNLLDLLIEARADIRQGVDPQLLDRERRQTDRIADKLRNLQSVLNEGHNDQQRIAAELELQTLTDENDRTRAEIRSRSPRYAALTQPQPLKPDQIRELLDDDTILLEYALGEKRSYLWAITRTDIVAYPLLGRSEIEKVVEKFRESMSAFEPPREGENNLQYIMRRKSATANYQQRALDLSNLVLGPVSSKLENKRLVIVADGALQYVPFAALPIIGEGNHSQADTVSLDLLIRKHEIVYQPSASALALIRGATRLDPSKSVAVLADPVFDNADDRVRNALKEPKSTAASQVSLSEFKRALRDAGDGDGNFKLERLRYSGEEANAIVAAAAPGSWMRAVGFKASRATALSPQLREFKIVHFATHGILNGKHPELSGLVLSLVDDHGQPEDGFLRLGDIYNLNLPVDLVVLSACRTGVGKQVRGEGLIGLTRGFMHAGAARVVASLWKVDDEATAELMKRFYVYMLEGKVPAAEALRRAQLDLMKVREQWRAPYYWAGFVLQGEWK